MSDKEKVIELINDREKTITAIVGLSKNAGKTTLLNWIIDNTHTANLGVLTTGRDGEEECRVFGMRPAWSHHLNYAKDGDNLFPDVPKQSLGTRRGGAEDGDNLFAKPQVNIRKGDYFLTDSEIIRKHSSSVTVMEKIPCKAGGESLWVVRAEIPLQTEIIGPPTVKEQLLAAHKLIKSGAAKILIDGSCDRKAITSAVGEGHLIFVVSPQLGGLTKITEELNYLQALSRLELVDSNIFLPAENKSICLFSSSTGRCESLPYSTLLGNELKIAKIMEQRKGDLCSIYLPASLTGRSFAIIKKSLIEHQVQLIVDHPFLVMLDIRTLKEILPLLRTVRPMKMDAVAVNSFAVNGNHLDCQKLRSTIRQQLTVPVIDVMEAGE